MRAGVVACAMAVGCSKPAEQTSGAAKAPPTAVNVAVQMAKLQPQQRSVEVVGTLYGDEETTVSAKVSGRVAGFFKDVGDRAEGGELLVQLEKRDYELVARQKELAVREVLAKLNLKELPSTAFDPTQVPAVRRAKLQWDNAQAKLERGQQLQKETPPLLSDQDFADLQTSAAVASSAYQVERTACEALLAEAHSRRAEWEVANQRLADTAIVVPPPHRVGMEAGPTTQGADKTYAVTGRLVSIGEYVKEGDALFRLVDDDPVKLRASVPERFVAQLAVGQKVQVRVEAYSNDFWGTIARLNPQIDPANRTFQVEVVVPNRDRRLKPGAFAKAWVQTHVDAKAVFVPKEAILSFAGVNKVFVIREGKAIEALVEVDLKPGDWREVFSGLAGNEQVAVSGLNRLANGVAVVVK